MPEIEWTRLVDGMRLGDHAIFLHNDFSGLARVATRFITAGVKANEIVVAMLPIEELPQWRTIFDEILTSMHQESDKELGALQIIPLLPSKLGEDMGPLDVVSVLRRVQSEARVEGRTGVRLIGRLSSALLDRGYEKNAVAIEMFAKETRLPIKMMCLYKASSLYRASANVMQDLVSSHTHSLTHVSQDYYLAEALG